MIRTWLKNTLLLSSSVFIVIIVMEGALRLAGISYPSFYTYDKATGAALRPGAKGRFVKEGGSYVRISKDGLNDREYSKEKPESIIRVAVLGDSYAEAFQVPREKAFWAVLEKQINNQACEAMSGKQIEVINFGVSGFGTAQELQMLRSRAWQYDPDIVLLAFTTGNDVRNNHPILEGGRYRPYFYYNDGELVLDNSFRDSQSFRIRNSLIGRAGYTLIAYSRVLQLIVHTKNMIRARQHSVRAENNKDAGEVGLDSAIYKKPESDEWDEAWNVTEGLLRLMHDEVQERGKKFLLMTLSNGIQVNPDLVVRKSFMSQIGVNDLFYPDKRLMSFANKEGIASLILAPSLQKWADQTSICLHGFENAEPCGGHWNEVGHKVAGILAATAVCELWSGGKPQ